jgi:hypothetical protein
VQHAPCCAASLEDLERDLHEHIHEENTILFPRVRAACRTLPRSSPRPDRGMTAMPGGPPQATLPTMPIAADRAVRATRHGAVWRADGGAIVQGSLEVEAEELRLRGAAGEERAERDVRYGDIRSVRIGRRQGAAQRRPAV